MEPPLRLHLYPGVLAVIADHFEGQLGSQEIVIRMFATANKSGVYADKAIYGQGLHGS